MRTATLHDDGNDDDDVGICRSIRPLGCYERSTCTQFSNESFILTKLFSRQNAQHPDEKIFNEKKLFGKKT